MGDLSDFHERMQGRLQRIEEHSSKYDDPQCHRNVVEDIRSLVGVLAEMIFAREHGSTYIDGRRSGAIGI